MRRGWVLVALLILVLPLVVPGVAAQLQVVSSNPQSVTLQVGRLSGESDQESASFVVRNVGSAPLNITGGSGDQQPGVTLTYRGFTGGSATVPVGGERTVTFSAVATRAASARVHGLTGTVQSTAGSVPVAVHADVRVDPELRIQLNDRLLQMPCPRTTASHQTQISLGFRNIGSSGLTVHDVDFRSLPFSVSPDRMGPFVVGATSTVPREITVTVPGTQAEGTPGGTVYFDTSANDENYPLQLQVEHPVAVALPAAAEHDFGNVQMLDTPTPWRGTAIETCGYKAGTVTMEGINAPADFVDVQPAGETTIGAGNEVPLTVRPRFTSAHCALLQTHQSWEVRFSATGLSTRTYVFGATPILIESERIRDDLYELNVGASMPAVREMAGRLARIIDERTSRVGGGCEEALQDTARLLTLGGSFANLGKAVDRIVEWNRLGLQNRSVEELVAASVTRDLMSAAVAELRDPALRSECAWILEGVPPVLEELTQELHDHYSNIPAYTELEQVDANRGLALVALAVGRADEAARFDRQAQEHFDRYVEARESAKRTLGDVEERGKDLQAFWVLDLDGRLVAWNPVGLGLLASYRGSALAELRGVEDELAASGDEAMAARVASQVQVLDGALTDGLWIHAGIAAIWAVLFVALGVHVVRGVLAAGRLRDRVGLGRFLVPG